jgi:capsular exopolysaccharide synthesis family protein
VGNVAQPFGRPFLPGDGEYHQDYLEADHLGHYDGIISYSTCDEMETSNLIRRHGKNMTLHLSTDQSAQQIDIRQYTALFLKWAWLLVLLAVVAAVGMFIYDKQQDPVYQASTKIMIVEPPTTQSASVTDYLSTDRLANTYAELFSTRPLLEGVVQRLDLAMSPAALRGKINVEQKPETKIIILHVKDTDPNRAALIANTMIEILIKQNEEMLAGRFNTAQENLQAQIDAVEKQISTLNAEIAQKTETQNEEQLEKIEANMAEIEGQIVDLQSEITELTYILGLGSEQLSGDSAPRIDPADIGRVSLLRSKELELSQLQSTLEMYQDIYYQLTIGFSGPEGQSAGFDPQRSTLELYQQTYQNLLSDYEAINLARMESENNVVQVEPAIPNPNPISPQIPRDVSLAAVVGLMAGGGLAFLIEMLDDTIKSPEDVTKHLGLPVLGSILHVDEEEGPVTLTQPRSPVSEAFRSLRTNIQFSSVDYPLRTLLVTSPSPMDGKTTVSINLSIAMAQNGFRTITVDADFRRPKLHKALGLSNRFGFSNYFVQSPHDIYKGLQNPTDMDNFHVMTTGSLPPNPSELFGSERMVNILSWFEEYADVVLIDSPPLLPVTDAAVLAPRVDGVILVVKPGVTKLNACKHAVDQLRKVGSNIIGIVLNDIPEKGARSYYYYRNGYYYAYKDYYGEAAQNE